MVEKGANVPNGDAIPPSAGSNAPNGPDSNAVRSAEGGTLSLPLLDAIAIRTSRGATGLIKLIINCVVCAPVSVSSGRAPTDSVKGWKANARNNAATTTAIFPRFMLSTSLLLDSCIIICLYYNIKLLRNHSIIKIGEKFGFISYQSPSIFFSTCGYPSMITL